MNGIMQFGLAEVYFEMGNCDDALKFSLDAALNKGDVSMKTGLFLLLEKLLGKKGNTELAKRHIELIALIKKENEFKITDELNNLLNKYSINIKNLEEDSASILRFLKKEWEKLIVEFKETFKGEIKNIIQDGRAGFIKADDGKEYYFRINSFKGNTDLLKKGLKVKFYLEDGFDKKKNITTKIATQIISIS
ncbi:MAG: hypothetical protein M3R36_17420 [Bacteroidota bacterium]|nr:hypothetical protein [Bacteroidota bacterium]